MGEGDGGWPGRDGRHPGTTGGTFLAPYKFGFANKLLDGSLNAVGSRLTVLTWTEFTDHSNRSNHVSTDTFVPLR